MSCFHNSDGDVVKIRVAKDDKNLEIQDNHSPDASVQNSTDGTVTPVDD